MARLGRRAPQQSRLRQPAAIGPAVVFRAIRVWLAQPYLPGQHVSDRATHSKLRNPAANGPPVVYRTLKVVLSGLQLPQQILARRGSSYRLQAPTVVSTPAAPFVGDPIKVRSVAVFALQAAGGQRRSPVWKLNAPAVVATAVTFGAVKVTTVDQPRRYQHAASKLQAPSVIGAAAAQFVPDPIRAKLTKRTPNYIRVKPQLRPPTVVDPQVVTTVPYPVRVKLVPPPSVNARRAKSILRPPRVVGAAITFRPLVVMFAQAIATRTGLQRRAPQWRLQPPTIVTPGSPFTLGFYDSPTPAAGGYASSLRAGTYAPGSPSAGAYGDGSPGAGQYDQPTPEKV